jgi:hypothetical protein
MAIYKVSYVIVGNDHPGTILNQDNMPSRGDIVKLGNEMFEIVEVMELVPPRGEFRYIHVTCRPSGKRQKNR